LSNNSLTHIALILDGNKRWSKLNNKSNNLGYTKGFENIKKIAEYALSIKLSHLTIFALSSENFNRSSINIIYEIIYKNFSKFLDDLIKNKNMKIKIVGSRKNLPKKIIDIFNQAEELSKENNSLNLNIAFNYGFKDEIRDVINKISITKKTNDLYNDIEIKELFYLGNIPDPDILIRTGGYQRLSNFIMFNLTYTELFFTKTLWPDFSIKEFSEVINKFHVINRKYGL